MLTFFVIVPILIAVFLYLVPYTKFARAVAIIAQAGLTVAAGYLFMLTREQTVTTAIGDYGILGITLWADELSAAFVLLGVFIFLMAAVYSYRNTKSNLFWFLFFIWEAALIGIFLTGDMFNMFVLVEVGTVAVSILIMYNRKSRSMYDGMIYLMINVIVVQFYLLGMGYVYRLTGVLDMTVAGEALSTLDREQLILPYALVMTFVGLKCAVLPLFSWLPKAHGTPGASAAVSAVLSGLHIKTGVYMFLRFQQMFEGVASTEFFMTVGILTAIVGVVMSLAQTNIKLILAYSTVAQVGLIIAGFSFDDYYGYSFAGSLYHMVTHAIFKAALFLGTGVLIQTYGTKDIRKIRGIGKLLPGTSFAKALAILGIIGMPLFSGSVSKYFLGQGAVGFLNIVMILINLGTITIFIKYSSMFFGKPSEEATVTRSDWWQQVPLFILGGMCLALGIFGENLIYHMFNMDKAIDLLGYLEKSGIFVVSAVVGFCIYKYWAKDSAWLDKVKRFELSFKGMVAAMGVFFGALVIALLVL